MRKTWKARFGVVFVLVALLTQYVFNLTPLIKRVAAKGTETPKTSLVDNKYFKVETQSQQEADKITWTVHYEKKASEETVARRMKWQIQPGTNSLGQGQYVSNNMFTDQQRVWTFQQQNFSNKVEKGSFQYVTPIQDKKAKEFSLNFSFQVDEQVTITEEKVTPAVTETVEGEEKVITEEKVEILTREEERPNVLSEKEQGPYQKVVANLIPVEEEPAPEETKPEAPKEEVTEEEIVEEEKVENEITEEVEEEVAEEEETEEMEEEAEEEASDPLPPSNAFGVQASNSFVGPRLASDPFDYTTDADGQYVTHGTHEYVAGNNVATSEMIKNYNHGTESDSDTVKQFNLGVADFAKLVNAYHEYGNEEMGRLNLKKTIEPTNDENQFKVTMDTIGDAIINKTPLDVVLVVDRSASMNQPVTGTSKTRWGHLKTAVDTFADQLLDGSNMIRMGMTTFGSEGSVQPYSEIASFGNIASNNSTLAGFTNEASSFKRHTLLSSRPVNGAVSGSGTPTFMGIETGVKLLTTEGYGARADATKVLITITDGLPSFRPSSSYNFNSMNTTDALNSYTSRTKPNGHAYLKFTALSSFYAGNGNEDYQTNLNRSQTVSFVNQRFNSNSKIDKYSVGFSVTGAGDVLASLAGNKSENAYLASEEKELTEKLLHSITSIYGNVRNATITDPISEYFDFVGEISENALIYDEANKIVDLKDANGDNAPEYAKNITVHKPSGSNNTLSVTNINFSKSGSQRQGYRISYLVELKEAYRDGLFYPVSNSVKLQQGENRALETYYAVPSAKVLPKTKTISIVKTSDKGLSLSGAEFNIWEGSNATGTPIGKVVTDNTGKGSFIDTNNQELNLPPGKTYTIKEVKALPGHDLSSTEYKVTISSNGLTVIGTPAGSFEIEQTSITLKAENKASLIDLDVLKKNSLTGENLPGAEFTLTRDDKSNAVTTGESGVANFSGLYLGSYVLEETKAPEGFDLATPNKWNFEVVANEDGSLGVNGEGISIKDGKLFIEVENDPRLYLQLNKFAKNSNKPLAGADFEFYQKDEQGNPVEILTGISNGTGQIIFDENSQLQIQTNKTYYLKETKAPEGYILDNKEYEIKVTEDGNLQIEDTTLNFEWNEDSKGYVVSYDLVNQEKTVLPATGGSGSQQYFVIGFLTLMTVLTFAYVEGKKVKKGDF